MVEKHYCDLEGCGKLTTNKENIKITERNTEAISHIDVCDKCLDVKTIPTIIHELPMKAGNKIQEITIAISHDFFKRMCATR